MTQLSVIRSNIADDLNRTDLNTQIDRAINRAVEHYESEAAWFNETTDDVTTVASQQTYGTGDGLATDVGEILKITFTSSSSSIYTLIPRTIQYILDRNTSGTSWTGQSHDWAWYNEKIYLYPTPDAAYTITVYYKKNYAALSADADTNDWLTDAPDLIEATAEWWLYNRILHKPELGIPCKQEEMDALRRFRGRTSDLLATGKLRNTHF